ncbi:MAG: bifunctional tRNA (5-methylaminomethyl-2-thiouridine)(34)-methyltransferase MnmD/FAD-dependent 5-carboxymethylaminomethyl-2-thiouridine(34) oxidoreductase MnmC [Tatlockia sp.]|nr:bifunctional tRNA (5-methylaminomethyl-2-thiouridine)(34)-methyltransferase MnmD/FAD-dependent 5-carboxymethylaminomethyl-2-thiouridine(34) oxidoreductase MnmC [Tatlockia sp.]
MSNPFIPIETARLLWPDGLPFSEVFDESYFSKKKGLAKKIRVFIEGNQLIERWQNLADSTFIIAETGFGSGLNFLLTWSLWLIHAPKTACLYYYSCEKFPLTKVDLQRCLDLWPALKSLASDLIDNYPILTPGFHQLQFAQGRINLTLMLGEATTCYKQLLVCGDAPLEQQIRGHFVDAWFLDGFSPKKNPALWSKDLLQMLALVSKAGTTLAANFAATMVKENIQAAGFTLLKRKGFGPKHAMVIAQFKEPLLINKKLRSTPWHVSNLSQYKNKKAIVLGAGLAGCYSAHALAKRGWQVILLDENKEVGQGASGNRQAILYPQLSAYRSPLTQFMLSAFLYAGRAYSQLEAFNAIGDLSGFLQLAINEQERLSQTSLTEWLSVYPELAVIVDAQEASRLAGIELDVGGLFIRNSGWLDSKALCQLLKQTTGIHWFQDTAIKELVYKDRLWHAGEHSAEVVVLANGYQANQFAETDFLPLKSIRGQMTIIAANEQSLKLKIPLCGDGHILPSHKNQHAFGASYHHSTIDKASYSSDDRVNLSRLAKLPTALTWSNDIIANWVGIRAATTDYLPVVGPVPEVKMFRSRFASLSTNSKRWVPLSGSYLPGLFLCAGFGSRGLTTIPLSAEWLASLINNEPAQISQAMVQSLAPARFLIKEIIKGYT